MLHRLHQWKHEILAALRTTELASSSPTDHTGRFPHIDGFAVADILDRGGTFSLQTGPHFDAEQVEAALQERRLLLQDTAFAEGSDLLRLLMGAVADLSAVGHRGAVLAVGYLDEKALQGEPGRRAPLLLRAVDLTVDSEGGRLTASPLGWRLNPLALELLGEPLGAGLAALRDAGLGWHLDGATVRAQWLTLQAALAEHDVWVATPALALLALPATGLDVLDDVTRMIEHGDDRSWQRLAMLLGDGAPAPAPNSDRSPVMIPFDVDERQREAVHAAMRGQPVVVEAPAGTGGTQTMAAVAAAGLGAGKRVLVVASRQAELEALWQRLSSAGLHEYCLPLFGDDLGIARISSELPRGLERSWRPVAGVQGDAHRLSELGDQLDRGFAMLHRPEQLGLSVFEVMSRLVELGDAAVVATGPAPVLDAFGFMQCRALVSRYAEAVSAVVPMAAHAWRLSARQEWRADGDLGEEVRAVVGELLATTRQLRTQFAALAGAMPGLRSFDRSDVEKLGALCAVAARSPHPSADLMTEVKAVSSADDAIALSSLDEERPRLTPGMIPRTPEQYVAICRRRMALRDQLGRHWTAALAAIDVHAVLEQFERAADRSTLGRWIGLRGSRGQVRAALANGAELGDEQVMEELALAVEERALSRALAESSAPARRWFGALMAGNGDVDLGGVTVALDFCTQLRAAFDRIAVQGPREQCWRSLVAQVSQSAEVAEPQFAAFSETATRWLAAMDQIGKVIVADLGGLQGRASFLEELELVAVTWSRSDEAFPAWISQVALRREMSAAGLRVIVEATEAGTLAPAQVPDAWERWFLGGWLQQRFFEHPDFTGFDGASQLRAVQEFVDLDRASLVTHKAAILARHNERISSLVSPEGLEGLTGALREGGGRQVLSDGSPTLWALRPCVLASPAAVAHWLDVHDPSFDLLILADAMAMPVAEAAGALCRADSVVVVGSASHPSSRSVLSGISGAPAGSVFDAAVMAGWPTISLSTQMRPAVAWPGAEPEVPMVIVPAAVAKASLVAPMVALAQASHLASELEAAMSWYEAHASALEQGRGAVLVTATAEQKKYARLLLGLRGARLPVHTLDEIAGADVDVVLLVLGIGDDGAHHRLADSDGLRCLGAASAAARQTVVALCAADDAALHVLGEFSGLAALADGLAAARRPVVLAAGEPGNEVARHLGRELEQRGWIVRYSVGEGAGGLDLAVVDPDDPSRLVIGIECGGAGYYWRLARDRERLRPSLLAQQGWRIHRMSLLDWWRDPQQEAQRAHNAVIAAVAASRQPRRGASPSVPPPMRSRTRATTWPNRSVDRQRSATLSPSVVAAPAPAEPALAVGSEPTAVVRSDAGARRIPPVLAYQSASVPAGRRTPDDLFDPKLADELGRLIEKVLAVEAPIHLNLLSRRVGAYFGIGKVSERVHERVRSAVASRAIFGHERDIIWRADQDQAEWPRVRVIGETADSRRDIDQVPLAEIASAALVVVDRTPAPSLESLVRDAAKLLGFARITDQVTRRVRAGVSYLEDSGAIRVNQGLAAPGSAPRGRSDG
jgi:hypothetical protein